MIKFKRYPKITNLTEKLAEKLVSENHPALSSDWLVLNKIHGANFSVHITKNEIRFGKRNGWIQKNENFYNYKKIVKPYISNFKELFQKYSRHYGCETIRIYGELFGGSYES